MTTLPKNLHQLVSIAAAKLVQTAVQKSSFIVNDVPREVQIATNEKILSTILNKLLTTVVSNSAHSCIRVKAKEYDDIICVSIKDNGSFSNYDFTHNIEQVQLLAKKLKGKVSIRNMEDKFTTILLSFPNFPKAA